MIEVKNLYKTFYVPHEVKALVNVTNKIEAGEVVVVCGPSGSGKSTFLRCLNRLETADFGTVLVDGVDIFDPKTDINKVRAEMGMVFQSFNLFPHLSILGNVTIAQKLVRGRGKKEREEKAMALLEKVGIADKANAYPMNLSGGQQQDHAV
jgi:polar amino acid transport system ATP-binding protein